MTETHYDHGSSQTAARLERRDDVVRAVSTWEDCDVAVLVEDGTDIGPIRSGFEMVNIEDFDAEPYVLLELNEQ